MEYATLELKVRVTEVGTLAVTIRVLGQTLEQVFSLESSRVLATTILNRQGGFDLPATRTADG